MTYFTAIQFLCNSNFEKLAYLPKDYPLAARKATACA